VSQPKHGTIDLKSFIFGFQGRSVIDFCVNRKSLWDFLLVINIKLGLFHRLWDTATYIWVKIANVSHLVQVLI